MFLGSCGHCSNTEWESSMMPIFNVLDLCCQQGGGYEHISWCDCCLLSSLPRCSMAKMNPQLQPTCSCMCMNHAKDLCGPQCEVRWLCTDPPPHPHLHQGHQRVPRVCRQTQQQPRASHTLCLSVPSQNCHHYSAWCSWLRPGIHSQPCEAALSFERAEAFLVPAALWPFHLCGLSRSIVLCRLKWSLYGPLISTPLKASRPYWKALRTKCSDKIPQSHWQKMQQLIPDLLRYRFLLFIHRAPWVGNRKQAICSQFTEWGGHCVPH